MDLITPSAQVQVVCGETVTVSSLSHLQVVHGRPAWPGLETIMPTAAASHYIPRHNGFTLPRRLLPCLVALLASLSHAHAHAQNETSASVSSDATTAAITQAITQVVQVFFINERAFEGLPYTLFHRDSGSVVGVDTAADRTTLVITTTRVDQRPPPQPSTHSHTHNHTHTHNSDTPPSESRWHDYTADATGHPSTITQGPTTFLFTGTRRGPNHTVVNECSLNGTVAASCNLTHVGSAWYTADSAWNGTYSTYRYNWTSGDRGGFAPVTITAGAELLVAAANQTGIASTNSKANGGGLVAARDALWRAVLVVGVAVAVGAIGFG
ncbi:hypothetical protein B0T22DRAFT_447509 [Podospora appendiculata]|uniref:Uncharacterized protein n=1 Tax=Podospora appendiculata TaxID=314037 RepID=A0AAE0XFZ9_9PEZI|nr:hypothetical protein B0T22DRAFT_447509 [Podospora appendiculata]